MAISMHWPTRVITVPKLDTVLVQLAPFELRALDVDVFRLALKLLEESEEGIVHPDTHEHRSSYNIGTNVEPRAVIIINGYTVTFEDGSWAADIINGKNNVLDALNLNNVQVRTDNTGSVPGLPADLVLALNELYTLAGLRLGTPSTLPVGAGPLTAGDIEIDVTGSCEDGEFTFTRQP